MFCDLTSPLKRVSRKMIVNLRMVWYNCWQRAGLYAGWELAFRPPITAAD